MCLHKFKSDLFGTSRICSKCLMIDSCDFKTNAVLNFGLFCGALVNLILLILIKII